jgi:hypothetical protein
MTTAPLQNDRFGTDRFAASREVAGPSGRFGLDRLRPSAAHADVREFGERLVVWVEFADSTELIRLTSGTSSLLERAIDTACAQRIPLVMVMTSAGADIVEGIAALHGWGLVAAALTRRRSSSTGLPCRARHSYSVSPTSLS